MSERNWPTSLAMLLQHEGGNDDDPRDPGGRTSRGITQEEYTEWREAGGLLTRDVWAAGDVEVERIYHDEYWNGAHCGWLPDGVDYVVFDYGVLSGTWRAAEALQRIVNVEIDGRIGPLTIAATRRMPAPQIINALLDQHLAWMRSLPTWAHFGAGWKARVDEVRAQALKMVH